jgi:hypothetical protein
MMAGAPEITLAERMRCNLDVAKYLTRNPGEIASFPRWLREHSASPMVQRMPWWPFPVPAFVRGILPRGAGVFEFGAGGSTLWFEDLGAEVTAVEHDRQWFELIRSHTGSATRLLLREPSAHGSIASEAESGYFDAYVGAIDSVPPASLDLVTIDGRCRVEAGMRAIEKVRPGGWLLLDDSWRPRYRPLLEALDGFDCQRFHGLRPGGGTPSTTSCWRIDPSARHGTPVWGLRCGTRSEDSVSQAPRRAKICQHLDIPPFR